MAAAFHFQRYWSFAFRFDRWVGGALLDGAAQAQGPRTLPDLLFSSAGVVFREDGCLVVSRACTGFLPNYWLKAGTT